VSGEFFADVKDRIGFGGLDSEDDLSFKVYDPNRMVQGKSMADHLRIAVCYWHSFNWPGSDVFGAGTFDRPWLRATDDGRCLRVLHEARGAVLLLP
jgi:xylose isomerase